MADMKQENVIMSNLDGLRKTFEVKKNELHNYMDLYNRRKSSMQTQIQSIAQDLEALKKQTN